jgi:kelch-like protein 10
VEVMKKFRLGLLDIESFLKKKEKFYSYATGNEECSLIIMDPLKFLYDLEMKTQKGGKMSYREFSLPCIPLEMLFATEGWRENRPVNYIQTYDTRADRRVKAEKIDQPAPQANHSTAEIVSKCT